MTDKRKVPPVEQIKGLFLSEWFRRAREYVEALGGPWFILSAKYGLVSPDELAVVSELLRKSWDRRGRNRSYSISERGALGAGGFFPAADFVRSHNPSTFPWHVIVIFGVVSALATAAGDRHALINFCALLMRVAPSDTLADWVLGSPRAPPLSPSCPLR
jgi:hypothetical protein